jgi:hypothetical protein
VTPQQKKANFRTAMIVASVALVFLLGFVVRMAVLGA